MFWGAGCISGDPSWPEYASASRWSGGETPGEPAACRPCPPRLLGSEGREGTPSRDLFPGPTDQTPGPDNLGRGVHELRAPGEAHTSAPVGAPSPSSVWGRQAVLPVGDWGGGRNKQATSQPATAPACPVPTSPLLPASWPQKQWCQPWGCQEACCHANGPGWVGTMVMSDSELLLGLWAREGRGCEEASPVGQQPPAPTARYTGAGPGWDRRQRPLL